VAKLAQTGSIRATRWRADAPVWARVEPCARSATVPVALLALALLVRVVNYAPHGWVPDTYEQLRASHRLVAGQFPLSRIYPPGVAVTMAPAFLVLPQSIGTMHLVNTMAALGLAGVLYVRVASDTGDRFAATLVALAAAAAPQFVFSSRSGLFDTVGTAWIVGAIMCVPLLRGRGIAAFAVYGAALCIAINVRATNAAFLPAALMYWFGETGVPARPASMLRAAFAPGPIVAAGVMAGLTIVLTAIGGWAGQAATSAPINFSTFGQHVAFYAVVEFGGAPAVLAILPLAIAGGVSLWRRNRPLVVVAAYMLVAWPLVYSPLPFSSQRYMLPALAFALLLAAHGVSAAVRSARNMRPSPARAVRIAAVGAALVVGLFYAGGTAVVIYEWPQTAATSDEGAFVEMRPFVAELSAGSLLVSPATRGLSSGNRDIEYLDLIDYSLNHGNGAASVESVMAQMQRALDGGRPVFYMHSRVEATGDSFPAGGPGYEAYFAGIARRFTVRVRYEAAVEHYTLYEVSAPASAATLSPARAW
jgi:hypothetical protein